MRRRPPPRPRPKRDYAEGRGRVPVAQLPSDAEQVKRFVKKKAKEAVKHAPNLQAHAWDLVVERLYVTTRPGRLLRRIRVRAGGGPRRRRRAARVLVVCRRAADRGVDPIIDEPPHVRCTRRATPCSGASSTATTSGRPWCTRRAGCCALQAPHDRSVLIAWRARRRRSGARAWLRLRFSVTSALVPETTTHQRCPVVLDARFRPQAAASTKVTTWSRGAPGGRAGRPSDAARPTRRRARGLRAAPRGATSGRAGLPAASPPRRTPRSARPRPPRRGRRPPTARRAGLTSRLFVGVSSFVLGRFTTAATTGWRDVTACSRVQT